MSPFITMPNVTITKKEKTEKPPQEVGTTLAAVYASDARRYLNGVSGTAAALIWIAGVLAAITLGEGMRQPQAVPFVLLSALVIGLFVMFALKVVDQWEKAVVLRFGRYRGLRGPGLFLIIPVVDIISHLVDQRVRATDVTAESALTRDTVPVNVDAIVFWLVWDAQKAVLEVQSYFNAIFLSS